VFADRDTGLAAADHQRIYRLDRRCGTVIGHRLGLSSLRAARLVRHRFMAQQYKCWSRANKSLIALSRDAGLERLRNSASKFALEDRRIAGWG
jgi:hypothetical protein